MSYCLVRFYLFSRMSSRTLLELNMKRIFSFKYCFEDQPLNYLLVESDIPDNAFDIAEIWQKKKGINSKCSIQFHQKRFESPDLEPDDIINGQKVWELPF